ncbi:MAG: hypothetical protein ACPL4E_01980 [Thermoproteota archaeon]
MSQSFPERLKNYLNERYKNERYFEPYEIETNPNLLPSTIEGKHTKWSVETEWPESCSCIKEDVDGKVWIVSYPLCWIDDWLSEILWKIYGPRIKGAEGEEKRRLFARMHEKEDEIFNDLLNRKNWDKYLKKRLYRDLVIDLMWSDEVAKRISEKFGIEIILVISHMNYKTYLNSSFDSKGLNEEQKFEEIKKRVEAILAARKLYGDSKERKKFWKELLAKAK